MAWFAMDDFAWLGLRLHIFNWRDALSTIFTPMAQGTIRPLSDRLYFLVLERLFGMDALPFRMVGFAFQLLNLWLAMRLVERVTGSRAGGVLTALLWIVNSALALAMSWTSAFNQILWPCLMLAGCHARWTWLETGSRRARVVEWICFLLGFGALELQVVYPVVAAALTLLYRKDHWRDLPPMFAVSLAYTVFNRSLAKPAITPVYALYWDSGLFSTFGVYLRMATGIWRPDLIRESPDWWLAAEWVAGVGCVAAFAWMAWKRERWALFASVWFLVTLAPILPLKNHISDYYLTVPVVGLAMAAGVAAARKPAWALIPVAAYAAASGYTARAAVTYTFERAELGRLMFAGVREASQLHPGKTILLTAVSSDQYWGFLNDSPFRLLPGIRVFLAPGGAQNVVKRPEYADPAAMVMDSREAAVRVASGDAVVYSPAGGRLTNVTALWKAYSMALPDRRMPPTADVVRPAFAEQVGEGWYPAEEGFRWSSGRALVRVRADAGERLLVIDAFRPDEGGRRGSVALEAKVNGVPAGKWVSDHDNDDVLVSGPLPAGLDLSKPLTVELQIDPVLRERKDTGRALGLAFRKVSVR